MNETVLFLVIGAAVILVGLFLWSRMEAKKNNESQLSITRVKPLKGMYKSLPAEEPAQKSADTAEVVVLVPQDGEETQSKELPFEVTSVSEAPAEEKKEPVKVEANPIPEPEPAKAEEVPTPAPAPAPAKPETAPLTKQEPLKFAEEKPATQEEKKEEKPVEEPVKPAKRLFPKEGLVSIHYDGLTETVGTVQSVRPVDGKKMMEMVANIRKLSLPMRIYLRRVDNKRWYQPSAVGNYTELAVVLLLANRQGCINEIDASRFVMAIQQVAIALGGDCDTEASHEIVARAKKLYDDVVRLDVQLNFVLASKEPLNPNFVAEAARLAGFTQLNPLRYFLGSVQQIGSATIFLTLDEFDRRYLTLALDAPLAQPDTHPLRTLFSVSNDLCARLNLQLQDSRDRAINSELAQAINHQLKKYYAEMYRANIEPGSPRARVLFTRD